MDMKKELGCLSSQILKGSSLSKSITTLLFPKDDFIKRIENLGICETAPLFNDLREFNSDFKSMRKEAIIHKLKFNLNDIVSYTNKNVTETVIVYADTVYMTGPLEVSFNLKIRARVVSISHPITITFKANQDLPGSDGIDTRYVTFNEGTLVMRQRTLGLVDIVDQHVVETTSSKCLPMEVTSSDKNIDVGAWFDTTILNMLNICSHVLLSDDGTSELAQKMVDFVLGFYHRKTDFDDNTQYITGLKFLKFRQKQDTTKLHYVPNYDFGEIVLLSGALHDQFSHFDDLVRDLEKKLFDMNENLKESNEKFEMAESNMMNMFNSEKALFLNAMKTADISILLSADESERRYIITDT